MAAASKIEWTDSTFNPWIGCTRVSPACDHCYAAVSTPARALGVAWGAGQPRRRTSAANWKLPLRWNARASEFGQCDVCGWRGERKPRWAVCPACKNGLMKPARRRVFCASLADVFDNEVDDPQWRIGLLELIAATPDLDWLLLTKRIGNAEQLLDEALDVMSHGLTRWRDVPWPNVWIGATIANQAEADRDIPKLLRAPAAVRFVSVEPLLGPVDIAWALGHRVGIAAGFLQRGHFSPGLEVLRPLDWVIVGGESGAHARPMHPDWARSLRDQCEATGVPFLFKQWGEWCPTGQAKDAAGEGVVLPGKGRNRQWTHRIGKKAAGRLLDGVEHSGFPGIRHAW
ncbi:phage Gp37/Gp68 family protein [Xanthomonas citri]|uniref:phage Gp37/Gp68 family protein n=1 Tax=Xanthomonas citri TaxID=346 RepID=UPI0001CECE38|nr:phage Gp37/Gp68 family protein [Xanthomonas citri]AMV00292.1 phage Gp37Gp68 [Xanthomonas citri pv. aurantifolii]AMV04608.1 phage Gp37Gp68 [Xanthomonas citri pv. aurantifolii]EFF46491.1 Gp37Gp68 family protein [Xanthomonas citri pv. aurantifolii str. ICPB 10535]MCC8491343.1 phage Gp37/Gp68 family protein [Xanthomonas citri pv. fuscans]TBW97608.1 phage Gp37Gp68 [Xanthomonas citri pv. aurantifolii]